MNQPVDIGRGNIRDVTAAYHNTIIELFDDHRCPSRKIECDKITEAFVKEWLISDEREVSNKGRASHLFWLTDEDGLGIDFTDFALFLITDKSPACSILDFSHTVATDYRTWHVDSNSVRKMTADERLQLLECIIDAGLQWTFEQGRVQGGFDQILKVTGDILSFCAEDPCAQNSSAYAVQVNKLFSRLISVITEVEPDYDHFPTMFDVSFMFNHMSKFLDSELPDTFKTDSDLPYKNGARQLTEWAAKIKLEPWRTTAHQRIGAFKVPVIN